MDPKLVCKIMVDATDGKTYRGSGYPIAANRVITAAHVVADARDITLFFGPQQESVDIEVNVEWSGHDDGIDVAVLRCELPSQYHPYHRLQTTPPNTPMKWFAHGFTKIAQGSRTGDIDDYHGELTKFSDSQPFVALESQDGPVQAEQWKGGSGSVAFDSDTSQIALAVITRYQGGKKLDHLVAVPICYLLNSDLTRDGFRRAIQFSSYEQREDYCKQVTQDIAAKLSAMGEKSRREIVDAIRELTQGDVSGVDVESIAQQTAACMVGHTAVTDVVGCLIRLIHGISQQDSDHVADMIDYLLPLNYAPDVVQRLHQQVGDDQLRLVEQEVSTLTLAEIIMAGYDQKLARFVEVPEGIEDVPGLAAIDSVDGPEVGPAEPGSETTALMRATRDLLYDLLARLGEKPLSSSGDHSDANLNRDIDGNASQLRGVLRAESNIRHRRTIYCVLKLPEEAPKREFRKEILSEVGKRAPQLVFVELMPVHTDDREFEVARYIKHIQKDIRGRSGRTQNE